MKTFFCFYVGGWVFLEGQWDCSLEQVQKCMHTDTLFNYAENYKMQYKMCIAFFHCNDNKITNVSAKYKWYKRVSDPKSHWCSLMAPTNVPSQTKINSTDITL